MNKRTRTISLIVTAIMLVSLLVAFPAFNASAADTNYALKSAGASYSIVSVSGDTEGDATYLGGKEDNGTYLADGITNVVETAGQSVAFTGSGRVHRVKFNLGGKKTGVNKIVLQNMVNNVSAGGNRGYVLSLFKVYAGTDLGSMSALTISASAASNGTSDEVTIVFNAVDAQYIWIDATSAAYVMTLDEVQIWASSSATMPPQTTKPSESTPVVNNGNYAAGGKYAIATLDGDVENDAAYLNATTTDGGNWLIDGKTNAGETPMASVSLMGTGKTHRIKFDLGEVKADVSKIVLKNMVNNVPAGGNRGYASFKVRAGATAASVSEVTVTSSEKDNGASSFEVTLQFAALDARYVYIDVVASGYVVTLDEVEIWGGDAAIVADPKFDLEIATPETVYAGDTIEVAINVKNIIATNGLVGIDFVLTYDAEKVTPVYTTDADMVANFFASNPSNRWEDAGCYYNAAAGQYNIRFADKDATTAYGVKADGALAFKVAFVVKSTLAAGDTVKFAVKDVIGTDPGDASYVGFGDVDGNGDSVAILVAEETTAPTTSTTAPVDVIYGDVNGDEEVDSADAGLALRADAGSVDLTDAQALAGDVNGDGEVDSADAGLIFRFDAGSLDTFPVEQ